MLFRNLIKSQLCQVVDLQWLFHNHIEQVPLVSLVICLTLAIQFTGPRSVCSRGSLKVEGLWTIQHDHAAEESSWGRTYGGCHSLGDSLEIPYNRSMSYDLPCAKLNSGLKKTSLVFSFMRFLSLFHAYKTNCNSLLL